MPNLYRSTPNLFRLSILLATCLLALSAQGCAEGPENRVHDVRVYDGDSFQARASDGRNVEVRLFGIDAPERYQAWSARSREALTGLLRGKEVELEIVDTDRYERIVARAILPDGRVVNEWLVEQGHAWVYRRYTDDPHLIALEDAARAEGRGLWSMPAAERIPPWEWRRNNRERGRER